MILEEEVEQLLAEAARGSSPRSWEKMPTAAAQRTMALWLLDRGHHAAAELCLRSVYARAVREESSDVAVASALDLARNFRDRSPREALRLVRWLEARPTGRLSLLQNLLGSILWELCRYDLADRYFARAAESAEKEEDVRSGAYAWANRAGGRFESGDRVRARGYCRRALEGLESVEDGVGRGFVLRNMAVHETLLGRHESALGLIEEAKGHLRLSDHLQLGAFLDLADGELELLTGERSRALRRFDSAVRRAKLSSLPGLQTKALVWRSITRRDAGGEDFLRDIEAAARDLYQRDLRHDGGTLYLIAACYADQRGLSAERFYSTSTGILGETAARLHVDHFARLVEAASERRSRSRKEPFSSFVTRSPEIVGLKGRLKRLVRSEVRILLEGESGTGKSFLARLIHREAGRKSSPFVVVDCTNLEKNLLESKLFGHVRGAFTGAVSDSTGLVEQANNGTLFLDEVGEMPVEIQAKLLYTIEEKRYRPIGARAEKRAEFRVIAATNRDVDEMLERGTLRQDLFYRLAGFRVRLSPLRERREDVVPLVERRMTELNERYGRRKVLRPAVWELLVQYDWPGNVRELNASLERGFHLAAGRRIGVEDLGLGLDPDDLGTEDLSWYTVRRRHLLRVLRLCRGNVTRAAGMLGLNRTTLIYKLKLLDIERPDFDPSYRTDEATASARRVADRRGASGEEPPAGDGTGRRID